MPYDQRGENGTFAPTVSDEEILAYFESDPSTKRCAEHFGLARRSMRERLAKLRNSGKLNIEADPGREAKIEQLLSSVPMSGPEGSRLKVVDVKIWGVAAKNNEGEIVSKGLDGIHAHYKIDGKDTPVFPLIQPATPTAILYNDAPRILRQTRTVPIISDAQIGYLRDADTDELEPTHDPWAMDVAKQIVRDVQPSEVVFIGDWADWPVFSRWQQFPEYDRVVQPSIETAYQELCEFKSAAGSRCGRITMIGSNHGYRPEKFILEHNKSALYVRQAGQPDSWPVFSEPFLLRYDEIGISFSGQYPGGEYYLLPNLVAMHAPPRSKEFGASVLHGHTHKITRSVSVQHRYDGRETSFVIDVGCLCQVGSAANRRRMMLTRVPSDRARTDWAQGIAVVNIVEGKFPSHSVDQIHIHQGTALYGGQQYVAKQLAEAV